MNEEGIECREREKTFCSIQEWEYWKQLANAVICRIYSSAYMLLYYGSFL